MVSEAEIFASCVIIVHPKDPNLILGVSRKDDHTDFGFPGGKRDLRNNWSNSLEDCKRCAIRELEEETGITIPSPNDVKLIYTGQDSTEKWCKCFWVKRCNSYNFIQKENEGIVKWCTWEELEDSRFGDFNKRAHQQLEKLFSKIDNPSEPMIGKEVTRMANVDWKLYFHENGNMSTLTRGPWDKPDEAQQPYVFGADLEIYKLNRTGRGTISYTMLDQKTNLQYIMNSREFFNMLKKSKSDRGLISGFWSFEKAHGKITLRYYMGKKGS